MAKLKEHHKVFVVQRLAMWDGPSEAAAALKAEYGIEISPQAAEAYDPNKRAGARLSKHLKALFKKTREDFVKHYEKSVPLANKAVRLQWLSQSAKTLRANGNIVGLNQTLEQIAKEVGGSYTNQRQFTGKDGGAIKTEQRVIHEMTQEERRAELLSLGVDPDAIYGTDDKPTVQ